MICTWTGISNDVKKHLQTAHKELCEDYNAQDLLFLSSSIALNYRYNFLFAYNEIFFYSLIIHRETIYVFVYYIGPAENDSKYQYKVMVMNNEATESVVVTRPIRSFTEAEDYNFIPKNCLRLHRELTESFRNEKGELTVLMEILRVGD